jgi:geranylgeranyl pyrophosphate synthase
MGKQLNIDFEKMLTHNGKDVFRMIKTKTNKYILIDCKTNKIIANTKNEILKAIKEFGERW